MKTLREKKHDHMISVMHQIQQKKKAQQTRNSIFKTISEIIFNKLTQFAQR